MAPVLDKLSIASAKNLLRNFTYLAKPGSGCHVVCKSLKFVEMDGDAIIAEVNTGEGSPVRVRLEVANSKGRITGKWSQVFGQELNPRIDREAKIGDEYSGDFSARGGEPYGLLLIVDHRTERGREQLATTAYRIGIGNY